MALIWASAALATPLMAGPIPSFDLEVRHSDLEIRQSSRTCVPSYTSKNGLNFTTYCNQNNPFNDAYQPFATSTMEECLERCSRFWFNGEGCFGIVWAADNRCWIRNSNTTKSGIRPSTGDHSAFVDLSQMEPLNTACPGNDLEVKTLSNGVKYTVNCNKDIPGAYDTCWRGYPQCYPNPFQAFYHATSLEECLSFCMKEHPLCLGAIYNPGLELGFANCWPKTGFPQGTLPTTEQGKGMIHSATITQIEPTDKTCPKDSLYGSKAGKAFQIHCGQANSGSNITSIHTQNVTACMDECATSDKGCVGILFDSSFRDGFSNCYLQNSSLVISDQPSATYAALTNSPLPSTSGSPAPSGSGSASGSNSNSNTSSSSTSKAWIAGPVLGGLAALALIGCIIFWWRRRKSQAAAASDIAEKDGSFPPTYYAHHGSAAGYAPSHAAPPTELAGGNFHANELPATGYTKPTTTNMGTSARAGPQELA